MNDSKLTSTISKCIFLIVGIFFQVVAFASTPDTLSNGLVEIHIHKDNGNFDVIDVKRNEPIVKNAEIAFTIAPYVELDDVEGNDIETDVPESQFSSSDGSNRVEKQNDFISHTFNKGRAISLITEHSKKGLLKVQFALYPGRSVVDIGFSFENLSNQPIRLREVYVLRSRQIFPEKDWNEVRLLNGNSSYHNNIIEPAGDKVGENNMLFFFPGSEEPRSLVLGGLNYTDYRKFVRSKKQVTELYADDPVGRRVDPKQTYHSPDHFYMDGMIDNPFESLEKYAKHVEKAQNIDLHYYTFPSTCMWFITVNHFGGDTKIKNNTVGAVREAENIANSGFLKYSPVAVRLVPDNYEQNNEQGWWDDEHWQMYGRKERSVVERHYEEPYETTEKWGNAVLQRGGLPFTYMEPGIRSEDYAEAFPGHMLYNKAHKYVLRDGEKFVEGHQIIGGIYGKLRQRSYDYTDPAFISHMRDVYENLRSGGIKGIFFDYPSRAFPKAGGMEDRYATATNGYRNVFNIARQVMGPDLYLQERLGVGSDATLNLVSSVRTAGDNNVLRPKYIRDLALRWYKNRRLTNYDWDGKALLRYGARQDKIISETQRRAILTLSYVLTGRLLLTESFRDFTDDVLYDLSRIYPFHATTLSARPIDAFLNDKPSIFDFPVSSDWHQLVLYNYEEENQLLEIPVSGNNATGALGMSPEKDYYLYDFWNDRFAGIVSGTDKIKQNLPSREARMLSVHAVKDRPQWISTNRHLMQGYVDFSRKPRWNNDRMELSGESKIVAGETYKVVIALNGYQPVEANTTLPVKQIKIVSKNKQLAVLSIESKVNSEVEWTVKFEK